ncbi:twin-arginine translocation signal domain-containing protein [Leisingera sp. S132]|uniref:twin-arginine translocation signal domain-containing protein n=1 Tax=Leisingera sp. S132 TaxID=2867016 RepID=UPI0021A2DCE2|nr:twin-arginine translocation signal domain-containing protein [Leisingera sp. S132]UWQ79500.1 twin-arginine translocation signal domain-containing protein [Leisingera sp. S132]
MPESFAGLTRRDFMARTAMTTAAIGILPSFATADSTAEVRFRLVKPGAACVAGKLKELRQSPGSVSQLVLAGEDCCLILVGRCSHTGLRRLEL